jgi:hypothetical protein
MSSRLLVTHFSLPKQPMRDLCYWLGAQAQQLRELRLVGPLLKDTLRVDQLHQFFEWLVDVQQLEHFSPIPSPQPTVIDCWFRNLSRLGITGNIQSFTTICSMTPYIEHAMFYAINNESLSDWLIFLDYLRRRCGSDIWKYVPDFAMTLLPCV